MGKKSYIKSKRFKCSVKGCKNSYKDEQKLNSHENRHKK